MRTTVLLVLVLVGCSGGEASQRPEDVDASVGEPNSGGKPASTGQDAASGGAGGKAPTGDAQASSDVSAAPVSIIDSHTHFWSERPSWAAPGSYLARSFSFDDFRTAARPLGITQTVWVTTEGPDKNGALLAQASSDPMITAFVGSLSFTATNFQAQFNEVTKRVLFRGVRVAVGDLNAALKGPQAELMQTNLALFSRAGLTLDVIAQNPKPADFEAIDAFAARFGQLKIVYNHLGEPDLPQPSEAWLAAIKKIGMRKNVYIKLSGLAEHLDDANVALADVRKCCQTALDAVFAAFGDDRVLFSSNWPVSAARADLPLVVKAIEEYVASQQRPGLKLKVFRTNTLEAYGIGVL